jgi:hypothetical protein
VLWALAGITLVFGLAQTPALGTISDRGAGILRFELARSSARADEIVTEWGSKGRTAARQSLILDYGYLVGYGLLIAGACVVVGERAARLGRRRLAAAAPVLAWAALAAAACDALENVNLLIVAGQHTAQPWPGLAFAFACGKFLLVNLALLFALIGWTTTRRARPSA